MKYNLVGKKRLACENVHIVFDNAIKYIVSYP